jgi:hypothetical protein
MGFLEIFQNPWFYALLLVVAFLSWVTIKALITKIPILGSVLGNRQTFMFVMLLGLAVSTGIFASMGFGSVAVSRQPAGSVISDLQVTTNFLSDGGCTMAEDNNVDDLWNIRCTDAQLNETASVYEADTGIITVRRIGDLEPDSCPVVASVSSFGSEKTPGDGNVYKIVEETTLSELEVYLNAGGAATTSSPKGSTVLHFAEGDADQTLGVLIEGEESAHDQLNQYSYKDVTIDVCGKPYIFRIHRMD